MLLLRYIQQNKILIKFNLIKIKMYEMYDVDINSIQKEVKDFSKKVDNINTDGDLNEVKVRMDELEDEYNELIKNMDECESDLSENNSSSLLNKLSQYKEDLEIARKKLLQKKETWQTKNSYELLKQGQLTGYEKVKAERDVIMDGHKEIDNQGLMVNDIGKLVKDSNKNLSNINNDLNNQGQRINNIQVKTTNMDNTADKTSKIMDKIEKRERTSKIVGIIAIIVVGLADIGILVGKLIKLANK